MARTKTSTPRRKGEEKPQKSRTPLRQKKEVNKEHTLRPDRGVAPGITG
jgi:hypothetical protein